ncbi:hypothetical protein KUTeg_024151 [Tegillarca granosa]|uniref:B box-type domain-containing protein n=1 Tax=Tegillarca granosa TaxID=220873 RepID=A0ABQ9DXK6_TEGGR|nr:hypothetical protein KUTeg_024151 [Tegillarca granosa]
MASKTTINDAQAPISKCEVCDRGVVAWFYCHECKQEMCKDCKTMHLRMNISKDHTVVCITRDKKNVGEKGQSNIPCSIHPCEHIQMFCTTCEMPVCIICIADRTHKNHEFDQLVNAKEKYKNELSKFVTKTKQEILNLETSLQSMQNHVKDYIKLSGKTKSDINRQRNEMKSQVDKIADDLIDEQEKRTIQEMKIMDSKTKEIQKILSEKIDLLRSCEDNVESGIETVIDITKDFRKKRIKLTTLSSIEAYSLPGFDSGNTSDLRKIFGELKDYEGSMSNKNISGDEEQREKSEDRLQSNSIPKVLAKIKLRPPLNTVFSLNGREAWCGQDKDLSLIQIDGSVKKNVKFDKNMYDITTRSTGDLLVTERWGHSIKQYSLDGTITTIDVPTLFEVRGLCTTADDHILICLYNDKDVSKVAKMSFEGQIKKFLSLTN